MFVLICLMFISATEVTLINGQCIDTAVHHVLTEIKGRMPNDVLVSSPTIKSKCQVNCAMDISCMAATYDLNTFKCYHSYDCVTELPEQVPGISHLHTSYFETVVNPSETCSNYSLIDWVRVRYSSDGIKITLPDLEACIKACSNNATCKFAHFRKGDCRLADDCEMVLTFDTESTLIVLNEECPSMIRNNCLDDVDITTELIETTETTTELIITSETTSSLVTTAAVTTADPTTNYISTIDNFESTNVDDSETEELTIITEVTSPSTVNDLTSLDGSSTKAYLSTTEYNTDKSTLTTLDGLTSSMLTTYPSTILSPARSSAIDTTTDSADLTTMKPSSTTIFNTPTEKSEIVTVGSSKSYMSSGNVETTEPIITSTYSTESTFDEITEKIHFTTTSESTTEPVQSTSETDADESVVSTVSSDTMIPFSTEFSTVNNQKTFESSTEGKLRSSEGIYLTTDKTGFSSTLSTDGTEETTGSETSVSIVNEDGTSTNLVREINPNISATNYRRSGIAVWIIIIIVIVGTIILILITGLVGYLLISRRKKSDRKLFYRRYMVMMMFPRRAVRENGDNRRLARRVIPVRFISWRAFSYNPYIL